MRRFEKIAEEKKRRQKERELSVSVASQSEILLKAVSRKNKSRKD